VSWQDQERCPRCNQWMDDPRSHRCIRLELEHCPGCGRLLPWHRSGPCVRCQVRAEAAKLAAVDQRQAGKRPARSPGDIRRQVRAEAAKVAAVERAAAAAAPEQPRCNRAARPLRDRVEAWLRGIR
jgi:hypothetical protein